MSDNEKTEIEIDGLDQLVKAFKRVPAIHVGILGSGARSPEPGEKSTQTNAQIGAMHEFGTTKAPQRSFLRIPLISKLDKRLKDSGVLTKKSINEVIKSGNLMPIMRKIGIIAEDVVLGAFASGGYGEWAPLKPATLSHKKNHQTLVETQQLRNSITNEVVEGGDE